MMLVPEIYKKFKDTCKKHYGAENPSQSDIVKLKKQRTSMEHYGVPYPSQHP